MFTTIMPISKIQKEYFKQLETYLSPEQLKDVKYLLKSRRISIFPKSFNTSKEFIVLPSYFQFHAIVPDRSVHTIIKDWNKLVETKAYEKAFKRFSKTAQEKITEFIAPHLLGVEEQRFAALLQLFSKERIHILLLGDPGTGKTDILRAVQKISPKSSFGLGSGTSNAGLGAAKKGDKIIKGLLPLADNGMCLIDELNLLKKEDRATLYSAMEKGFITFDKGGSHLKVSAKVRILATANPKGDHFIGNSLELLKQQIPFDSALLSRFHLIFIIRKPSKVELLSITKKIIQEKEYIEKAEDLDFIKKYVDYAHNIDVEFDKELEDIVVKFIDNLNEDEDNLLIEIGPRTVVGILRLAQAKARISLNTKTTKEDVVEILKLLKNSLYKPLRR